MSYIKLNDLIQKAYKEHPEELISTPKIQPPDINTIFERLDQEIEDKNKVVYLYTVKSKKLPKKAGTFKRAVLLTASIIILSIIISAVNDTPQAKAIKLNILNTIIRIKDQIIEVANSNSGIENEAFDATDSNLEEFVTVFTNLDEAKMKIDSVLLLPKELPPGYKFDRIEWAKYSSQRQAITQIYEKQNDILEIAQIIDPIQIEDKTFIQNIDKSAVTEMVVGDRDILLINISSELKRAIWYEDDFRCEIRGNLTEEEIVNIIDSIE